MAYWYKSIFLPYFIPALCLLALFDNGIIILTSIIGSRFKQATFISIRILCVALAVSDILILIFRQGYRILGKQKHFF